MTSPPSDVERDWHGQLARAEADVDCVLLSPGVLGPDEPWTVFCLADAEWILAITRGTPHQSWLARSEALTGCELVCVGAPASDQLIDQLHPRNVRTTRASDGLPRVMREVATRVRSLALGVVLSGGGTRAFCHLGLIEELTRCGVTIDRIAGVSLGALVAASVARGDSHEMRYEGFRDFTKQKPSNDYTIPLVALTRGRKTAGILYEAFGTARIEELQKPFFCTRGDPTCHPGSEGAAAAAWRDDRALHDLRQRRGDGCLARARRPRHHPGVADIALLDWHRLPEAREAGILTARQALEQHAGFFAQIGVS